MPQQISRRSLLTAGGLSVLGVGALGGYAVATKSRATDEEADAALWSRWVRNYGDLIAIEGLTPVNAGRAVAVLALMLAESQGGSRFAIMDGPIENYPVPPSKDRLSQYATCVAASKLLPLVVPPLSFASQNILGSQFEASKGGVTDGSWGSNFEYNKGVELATTIGLWSQTDGYLELNAAPRRYIAIGQNQPPVRGATPFLKWVPTPPRFAGTTDSNCGPVRPLGMLNAKAIACPPPPQYSGAVGDELVAEARQVLETTRTETTDQRNWAEFWADARYDSGTPVMHWMLMFSQAADQLKLPVAERASIGAALACAMSDASLSTFAYKYQYVTPRPVTLIQEFFQSDWLPTLETPSFPEHPSGHSTISFAAATTLEALFPLRNRTVQDFPTNPMRLLRSASYASWIEMATIASNSRVWGGIHYPSGIAAGQSLGKGIGEHWLRRYSANLGNESKPSGSTTER